MTKKRTSSIRNAKSTRGRGGGKRGPVRIKVEDRVVEQEAVLRRRGNSGIYEDVMLYVKNQPLPGTRKRGRPRKCLQDVGRQMNSSTGVLYLPSVKQGCNQLVPILTKCTMRRNMRRQQQLNPVKCIPNTVVPVKRRPVMAPPRIEQNEDKVDWPDDLNDLVANWDNLPEKNTREVVKWLHTPFLSSGLPTLVRNVHTLVSQEFREMGNVPLEDKILEYGIWLEEQSTETVLASPTIETPQQPVLQVMSPKVVVEVQPNHIVDCGQWSSMADNLENLAL